MYKGKGGKKAIKFMERVGDRKGKIEKLTLFEKLIVGNVRGWLRKERDMVRFRKGFI